MNKSKLALVVALGMSFSAMAVAPAMSEDASSTPGAKVEAKGKSCAGGECHKGGRRGHGGFMGGLDLTDEQLEKLHSLKTASFEASGPKRLELRSLHRQMKDSLTKPGINKSELLALQSKINSLNAELSNSRVSFMADASSILTEDQRQKVRRSMLMGGFGGHHKKFHGRGHHGGPRHFGGMRSEADLEGAPQMSSNHEAVASPAEELG